MSTRNSNARFDLAPQVEIQRSTFDRSMDVKTSFNVGELVPFYVDEVLPGDTFEISTSKVARLQTLITPVMDNLYLDTYYFFVPNRLVWEHWQNFCGESTTAWTPDVEYSVPTLTAASSDGIPVGTIGDYFGLPTGVSGITFSALPFRAYTKIVNDWFRDENLQDEFYLPLGDAHANYNPGASTTANLCYGGKPFVANKYHDYFTSCLPAPQKGPDVTLPLGTSAPVTTKSTDWSNDILSGMSGTMNALRFKKQDGSLPTNNGVLATHSVTGSDYSYAFGSSSTTASYSAGTAVLPSNLFADLSLATASTVNKLRQAFQIQRLYEKDARGGTRYIELLKSHFGVSSPDARLQRAEYLGGNRVPLNIEQVTQTSSTSATSPLASQAAYSITGDLSYDVSKSFVEHGFIIGLCCARYDHSYQQGMEKFWSRSTRFDFYWPALANLGEMAVLNKEIYATGTASDDEVFGYQEAWADYRYKPNHITGEMRSQYAQSLDIWHFADNYASQPYLSAGWMREDASNIDRSLAIPSGTSNQIFADILVSNKCTRPMPLYSIPGMIDHF